MFVLVGCHTLPYQSWPDFEFHFGDPGSPAPTLIVNPLRMWGRLFNAGQRAVPYSRETPAS